MPAKSTPLILRDREAIVSKDALNAPPAPPPVGCIEQSEMHLPMRSAMVHFAQLNAPYATRSTAN